MIFAIVTLLLAAGAPAGACKEAKPGLLQQAHVTCAAARRSALENVKGPHARVRSAELEEEGGRLVWSFDISRRGRSGVEEIQIDAKTGELVSAKHESPQAEVREKD